MHQTRLYAGKVHSRQALPWPRMKSSREEMLESSQTDSQTEIHSTRPSPCAMARNPRGKTTSPEIALPAALSTVTTTGVAMPSFALTASDFTPKRPRVTRHQQAFGVGGAGEGSRPTRPLV